MSKCKPNKARRNHPSTVSSKSSHSDFKRSTLERAINQHLSLPRLTALTAAAVMALNGPAHAQSFSAVINLSDLDGSDGFRIQTDSVDLDEQFSIFGEGPVSSAGDINGDGVTDVILGRPASGTPNDYDIGASVIVFGGAGVGDTGDLSSGLDRLDGTNGFYVQGVSEFDRLGDFVSDAGDINGDGFSDVIIGATGFQRTASSSSGAFFVVFGGTDVGRTGKLPLSTLLNGTNGFVISNENNIQFIGDSASAAGDVNGDGFADLIIGSPNSGLEDGVEGQSMIVFGGADVGESGLLDLSTLDGTNGFVINGVDELDFSGRKVSGAGDLNNDGVSDIIIAAPGAEPDRNDDVRLTGEAYVVFGGANVGASGSLGLSTLNGNNGFVVNGVQSIPRLPFRSYDIEISGVGDVNGDGISDMVLGAAYAFANGNTRAGRSYVVFGGNDVGASGTFDLRTLDGENGFVIKGIDEGDFFGWAVSDAGDVNDDGLSDFIIGSLREESRIVFGAVGLGASGVLDLSSIDGANGFTVAGAGSPISAAGDINSDGVSDVLIGRAVVFGMAGSENNPTITCNGLPVTVNLALGQRPTGGADVIQGTEGADTIRALSGDDTICGLGGDDLINAGGGDDWVDAGSGNDTVFGLAGADVLRGRSGADRIFGGVDEDLINGDGGADRLDGGSGNDLIYGGGGNDELFGQDGADALFGGNGNDSITGANGADDIDGGNGNDTLFGRAGNDTLEGGFGDDRVFGNGGNDTITDKGGDDRLFGSAGNDVITDTSGNNVINGGSGNDTIND